MGLGDMLKAIVGRGVRSDSPDELHIQLNDKAMPVQRGAVYEDPLQDYLSGKRLGEIVNSGSMLTSAGEIEFSDIDIELSASGVDRDELIRGVAGLLESRGIPKGSFIVDVASGRQFPVGKLEGLGVYLNGTDLPPEVYEHGDVNHVIEQILLLLGLADRDLRFWEGSTETALYFYGESFEGMKAAIAEFIGAYPLCQECRIVQIA